MATSTKRYSTTTALGTQTAVVEEIGAVAVTIGGAVSVYEVKIDNTGNTVPVYVKFYNNAAPTVGTTAPDMEVFAGAAEEASWVFSPGIAFDTAVLAACVMTPGTDGVDGPTNPVTVAVTI
jgi:hypothetical protein